MCPRHLKQGPDRAVPGAARVSGLGRFASLLLARALAGEGLLGAAFVAGLQVKGMLLDVLDDVLLLDLALEPPEGTLDRFAFLNLHFRQSSTPPSRGDFAPDHSPGRGA